MKSRNTAWFYVLGFGILLFDQISKALARSALVDGPVTIVPGFFDLRLSFNTGGAFGILPNWAPLFILVALAAVFAIVRLSGNGWTSRSMAAGLGLLLGGAVGNLVDRVAFPVRGVTDFLSLHIGAGGSAPTWPTFNIADAAIVVGAGLLFFHVYIAEKRKA